MKSVHVVGIATTTFVLGAFFSTLAIQDAISRDAAPKSASTHSVSRPTSSQATAAQTPTFLSLNPVEQCFLPAVNDDKLRQDIARILQDELRLALAETNSEVEHARFEDPGCKTSSILQRIVRHIKELKIWCNLLSQQNAGPKMTPRLCARRLPI